MKNKTKKILGISGLVTLFIILVASLFMFTPLQQTVFNNLPINAITGLSCPDGYSCDAKPIMVCNEPTGEQPQVILRCGTGWIAWDVNQDDKLDLFEETTTRISGGITTIRTCPNGIEWAKSVNNEYGVRYTSSAMIMYKQINPVPDNKLSRIINTPLIGFELNEVISGNINQYDCAKDVFKNNVKIDTITYVNSKPTDSYAPRTYSFIGGDIFRWSGQAYWETTKLSSNTCNSDIGELDSGTVLCDANKLYRCTTPLFGGDAVFETIDCGARGLVCSETTNSCEEPYTVEVKINGVSVDGKIIQVLAGVDIPIVFSLDEPDPQRRNVIVSLMKGNEVLYSISDDSSRTVKNIVIQAPSQTGYYDLVIFMPHPDGDYERTTTIQTITSVEASVSSPNPIQYDNQAIVTKMNTYQSGVKVPVFDYQWDATFRNMPINPTTTRNPSRGLYEAYFQLSGEGTLRVRAKAQYEQNGAWSDWSNYYEVQVKEASISILPDFKTDIVAGSYTFEFETKDSTGVLTSTTNTIMLESQESTITLYAREISTGKYNFDVNFPTGGLYYLKITSMNPSLGSTQLNNGLGLPVNIFSSGSDPTNASGGINWIMWGLFAVLFMGIVLIVYAIVKKGKRGKKQ